MANLVEQRNAFRVQWENEREVVLGIQKAKEEIEQLKVQGSRAEREGDFSLAAEIRFGKIPEVQQGLEDYNEKTNW